MSYWMGPLGDEKLHIEKGFASLDALCGVRISYASFIEHPIDSAICPKCKALAEAKS
jgi:hypothetical protein